MSAGQSERPISATASTKMRQSLPARDGAGACASAAIGSAASII